MYGMCYVCYVSSTDLKLIWFDVGIVIHTTGRDGKKVECH